MEAGAGMVKLPLQFFIIMAISRDKNTLYIHRENINTRRNIMGGNRPITFITIGGVRYHRDSVVEQSETTDDKGNKTYNVTLEGGTKLSYPQQKKSSNVGYNVIRFDRQKGESKVSHPLKGGNRTPLVIAHKPINNNKVCIGLFGLQNATITGSPNVSERIDMSNCHNNTIYLNDNRMIISNIF